MGNLIAIKCMEGATVVGDGPKRRWVFDAWWKAVYMSRTGDRLRTALQTLLLVNAIYLVFTSGQALYDDTRKDVEQASKRHKRKVSKMRKFARQLRRLFQSLIRGCES